MTAHKASIVVELWAVILYIHSQGNIHVPHPTEIFKKMHKVTVAALLARSVALDVDAGLAYVAAINSDSLAIVDVGTDPTNPTLLGVLKDSINMDYAYSVALDVDAGLAYVAASISDSLAIVDVATAISWCAQDFSIASNRHNITTWLSSE